MTGEKHHQKITIPISRLNLQNFAFPDYFPHIFFNRYFYSLLSSGWFVIAVGGFKFISVWEFPGFWLVEQFPHICRQPADWIELQFAGWTHQDWLTFGHIVLNSHCFLTSDWSSNPLTFAEKPLIRLSTDLVASSLYDSPGLSNLWSHTAEFQPFSSLWLVKQFLHICRPTVDQIG